MRLTLMVPIATTILAGTLAAQQPDSTGRLPRPDKKDANSRPLEKTGDAEETSLTIGGYIKLDVIEAAIAEPGKAEPARLDELADAVAEAMAEYLLKLPPRTLVMMFGDHGFLLDPVVTGTSAGRSGGASPEEVLVPAFAWLVGNVH